MITETFQAAFNTSTRLAHQAIGLLPNLTIAATVLCLSLFFARLTESTIVTLFRDRERANLGLVIGRLTYWAIASVACLVCLSIVTPSFSARDLIQMLGISGVAIGFAFKDVFQNFLAGLIILVSEPFKIGERIAVANFEGIVAMIETRATVLLMDDGSRVILPNSIVFTSAVTVKKERPRSMEKSSLVLQL